MVKQKHHFKKRFGQNFLRAHSKFPQILVGTLSVAPGDIIIEIGPGDGAVTKKLLDAGAKVVCVEVDYDLIPKLIGRFGDNENFNIVNEDILQVNLNELVKRFHPEAGEIKVVGSLPFNISKRIIDIFLDFHMQNETVTITVMSFILQEEVAKDYVSKPPRGSFLGNYIKIFGKMKKFESIPASQFVPKPQVNGGIVSIEMLPSNQINPNYRQMTKLFKIGFSAPRKKLLNNFYNSNKYKRSDVDQAFKISGIEDNARAAELEFEEWEKLFNGLHIQ